MPRRKRYLFVCTKRRPDDHRKGSCAVHGSEELVKQLKLCTQKAHLDIKVTSSGCFDLCWVGAAALITPDNLFVKNLKPELVPRFTEALAALEQDAPATHPARQWLAEHLVEEIDFEDPARREDRAPLAASVVEDVGNGRDP